MSDSYLKGKHIGLKVYRFKNNPEEEYFAKKWEEWCDRGHLEWIMGIVEQAKDLTERDAQVAATVIQWLGSPVGRGFLSELGYIKNKNLYEV